MRTPAFSRIAIAIAAASVSLLAACHEGNEIEDPDAPSAVADAADETEPLAQDLLGALETRPEYSTLLSAIQSSGMSDRLSGDGPVTLFAPTNDAFADLPESELEQIVQLSNRAELRRILAAHVVTQALDGAAIDAAIEAGGGTAEVETLGGGILTITEQDDALRITAPGGNRSVVTEAGIAVSNGIVHGVDAVLRPAEEEEDAGDEASQ